METGRPVDATVVRAWPEWRVSRSRRPRVVVLDYGSGNLRSAQRALQRAGADAEVSADRDAALSADGLVVPGVGAFAACMAGLLAVGGEEIIEKRLAGSRPVLGICVGMQVLFAEGVEHGERTAGCGQWPGVVDRLTAPVLPHMGWNTIRAAAGSMLLAGIGAETRFYFVHSYAARSLPVPQPLPVPQTPPLPQSLPVPQDAGGTRTPPLVSWCTHGEPFVAAVEHGPLCATQFHPEKSGDAGAVLLSNWLESLR